jgi:hypothetical protein
VGLKVLAGCCRFLVWLQPCSFPSYVTTSGIAHGGSEISVKHNIMETLGFVSRMAYVGEVVQLPLIALSCDSAHPSNLGSFATPHPTRLLCHSTYTFTCTRHANDFTINTYYMPDATLLPYTAGCHIQQKPAGIQPTGRYSSYLSARLSEGKLSFACARRL